MGTRKLVVDVPMVLHEDLRVVAEREDRSMAAIVRLAVQRYVSAANAEHYGRAAT